MAEAHQGVAFSFTVTEDDGLHLNVSLEAFKAVLHSGFRSWRKFLSRFINQVLNGVYPSHPLRGLAFITFVVGAKRSGKFDPSFGIITVIQDKIPRSIIAADKKELAASLFFASATWVGIVAMRKYTLQALFSYQGWMYETRGKVSLQTKLWNAAVKFLIGSKPNLYSYQSVLPSLPVPSVKETIRRYLRTIKPLYDEESYARIEREAIEFERGVGKRLQRYLNLKWLISSNYVSDWWEEYVYLRGRSPIMVNSNFYALDSINRVSTKVTAARAANCIAAAFVYRKRLSDETLEPIMLQDQVPLCSHQYERQFNTTRIPGEATDKLMHWKDSKHVAVYCKGKWYRLNCYHQSKVLNAKELQGQIERILEDETDPSKCEKYLGALTAGDRIPWAQARNKYFSYGQNKVSLSIIEKAAFVVVFDEESYEITKQDPSTPRNTLNNDRKLDEWARGMLHGKGYDRWFDKSFNMIFSANGRVGLNTEHSWADAPVTGHMWECVLADEAQLIGYDEHGNSRGVKRFDVLPPPIKLRWEFNSKIEEVIMSSYKVASDLLNDVDLHIYAHDEFGKGFSKKCKTSPDAFVQMALQLAYYNDIGKHHLTYEASMTRLFKEGRTETVRSCSVESCAWVKSMVDEKASNQDRLKLFKKACDYHQTQYRDAMTGRGVDRHLFTLYVVSKYLELDTPFLKEVLSEPWRLSTSQTPSSQTNKIDLKKYPEFMSAGGGFGPVADDGYGVSYIFCGEDNIFFHISSKKSSDKTESFRFGQRIKAALLSIKKMFEDQP